MLQGMVLEFLRRERPRPRALERAHEIPYNLALVETLDAACRVVGGTGFAGNDDERQMTTGARPSRGVWARR
jgi:hypothetical protein